jgi:hypothetical protein
MNKQIQPIPQINHVTERLKLATACEFLYQRICTMEVQIQSDPNMYSFEDLENFVESSKFLNEHYGKKLTSWITVQTYMNENF